MVIFPHFFHVVATLLHVFGSTVEGGDFLPSWPSVLTASNFHRAVHYSNAHIFPGGDNLQILYNLIGNSWQHTLLGFRGKDLRPWENATAPHDNVTGGEFPLLSVRGQQLLPWKNDTSQHDNVTWNESAPPVEAYAWPAWAYNFNGSWYAFIHVQAFQRPPVWMDDLDWLTDVLLSKHPFITKSHDLTVHERFTARLRLQQWLRVPVEDWAIDYCVDTVAGEQCVEIDHTTSLTGHIHYVVRTPIAGPGNVTAVQVVSARPKPKGYRKSPETTTLIHQDTLPAHTSPLMLVPDRGVTFVCDIDDVLRQARIWFPLQAFNELITKPYDLSFPTMPEVLQDWKNRDPNAHFHYLTVAPDLWDKSYIQFLSAYYPPGSFDARAMDHLTAQRMLGMTRLIQAFPHRRHVLVGDSSSAEFVKAAAMMAREFPEAVACVLLRDTKAKDPTLIKHVDLGGFRAEDKVKVFVWWVPDDLLGIDFEGGGCRNLSSVPERLGIGYEGQ